ncbi:MAG: adenylate/guanylate cyclase domain-containing protein [Thermodesulfobacteriota bacterium]|nr:adenylate/guanylate cyclase domain-containing protein [Thermodesulfobacteriota bacterium]
MRRKLTRAILIVAVLSVLSVSSNLAGLFEIPELKTVDFRTKLSRSNKLPPSDIVLILIDETSLNALNKIAGRWPWPRYVHAELIDFLSVSGARAIIMDILFTENESAQNVQSTGLSDNDLRLIESTESAGNVYHAVQIISDKPDPYNPDLLNKGLPEGFVERFSVDFKALHETVQHNNYYLPFTELYEASKGIGVVSFSPDKDGVYRKEKLFFGYQDNFFPSLFMAPIVDQFGCTKTILKKGSLEIINNRSHNRIPLIKNNDYFINMYGRYNAYSFSGVFLTMLKIQKGELDNLPVQPDEFRNKIVFIGASAAGVEDLKNTSIASKTPGVFLHASAYGNMISGDFLRFPGPVINFLPVLILLTITVFSIFYFKTLVSQVLFPLVAVIAFLTLCLILFNSNIVLNVLIPSLAALSAYVVSFTYLSFTEGREKRKIKNVLGQYVSPAMLSTVLKNNQDDYLKAEVGSKEILTIFFSDIRDFTTITEKYKVEEVVEVLNAYLSRMVNIIFNNEGTLDKFIGDAIVAFWGAPVKIHDHHYKAVITGLQMRNAIKTFNRENHGKGLPQLRIGIGIHTGEVILGNIGSEKKLDYTVIGDSVNMASRLEGLTKTYNSSIIISQDTYEHVQNDITCRLLDHVKVKGKDRPITIYEVIDAVASVDEQTSRIIALTQKGFKQYRQRAFSESISTFDTILGIRPNDFLSKMFISRCLDYQRHQPPDDWDGYCVYETK